MSLLEQAFQKSFFMQEFTSPDGRGGEHNEKAETGPIYVAYSYNTSTQERTADKQGAKNIVTLTTKKDTVLKYHDVIKRAKDGKIFRVISSDARENQTPETASLNMRQVEAEEWSLPNG